MYIVNVPLIPFKSPLLLLPPTDKIFEYLCYKPSYLSPIQNQGNCGSCFVYAVSAMLSDKLMITTGGIFDNALSIQQIMSCFDRKSCDGGSPEDLCIWLSNTQLGINIDKVYPYKQYQGGYVNTKCIEKSGIKVFVEKNSIKTIVSFIPEKNYDKDILTQNILNMKKTLIEFGPFFCAMSVYDDLFTFGGTSIYKHSKNSSLIGGHAIEIIGYCEKNVDPRKNFNEAYWICRNSWGEDWPLESSTKGYFCIRMGYNECGIESRCGIAMPIIKGMHTYKETPLPLSMLRWESFPIEN
jgi:C1A family cysteine protease